jgi:hypothetical protein
MARRLPFLLISRWDLTKEDGMKARLSKATAILALAGLFIMAGPQHHTIAGDWETSVEEILERYIEVIGGREAIEKLTTRVCIGQEVTDLSSREQPIFESHYFEAYAKNFQNCYFEEWTDAGIFQHGFDGEQGWAKDRCGVRDDEHFGKRRFCWLLQPQNALVLKDYFPNLVLVGTRTVRGIEVYALESPAIHRPLFFDIESGLLVGFGYNWEIHDYREVDGVLFPHLVHMSRKGGSTVYKFTEVRHNEVIDDSLFAMPTR